MKNYNKILEAINRGINLALDDFDDEEIVPLKKSKLTLDKDYTQDYLDLMNNYVVDLGLPSGTLWCKYNLGCNYDLLNNHPENSIRKDWYGDYYAWGEIEPNKGNYSWDNYKFAWRGSDTNLTKYVSHERYLHYMSDLDYLEILQNEDDVAYKNMHFGNLKFHIPTKELFEELLKYTTSKYLRFKTNENWINTICGYEFTSKINGNKLFLPCAGFYLNEDLSNPDIVGYYWTSTRHKKLNSHAYDLTLEDNKISYHFRAAGVSVRPVLNLK